MKKKRLLIAALLVAVIAVGAVNLSRTLRTIPTDFSKIKMIYASDGVSRYYYDTLSEDSKVAYTLILNSIRKHPKEVEIPQLSEADFHEMFCALSYDNPELLCLTNESQIVFRGAKAYFVPQYFEEADACEARRQTLETAVNTILSGVRTDMDAFEKELYFHDVICENTVYTPNSSDAVGYSAYDALVEGRAVCEGYSRAMQLLMTRVGIPNYLVTGVGADADGTSEGHMWNVVTIQGENYYLDVTWDDMDKDNDNRYNHTYFNVTSADIQSNHLEIQPDNNNCTATAFNYFVRQDLYIEKYNAEAETLLIREIQKTGEKDAHSFEVRFADRKAYESAVSALIDNGGISELVQRATRRTGVHYENVIYVRDEDMLTLQIAFS